MTNEELLNAMVDYEKENFCTACFTGEYPISIDKNVVYGEGQGIITAKESGETATIRGYGIGRSSDSGEMTIRGTNFYKSSSEQLSSLNNTVGAFEFEVDKSGNYQLKVWEWK